MPLASAIASETMERGVTVTMPGLSTPPKTATSKRAGASRLKVTYTERG
jgi:hypothetical protein